MLDFIDPFALKERFDLLNFLRGELGDLSQDLRFLRAVRRALLPIAPLDRRPPPSTDIFPPLRVEPHPVLSGKRVGLVTSGGSAALVTLCGIARAFEEADIKLEVMSVCSGSAIWGSMMAAGMTAQQMLDLSMSWTPRDMVDIDSAALRNLVFRLGRGFTGAARGDAIETTLERSFHGMTLAQAKVPCHFIVLNIDTNELGYFGPNNRPNVTLARAVRTAIALPLFCQPVKFGDHHFVDGGVVNIFPLDPLLELEPELDFIIGVNVIMPKGFRGEDITGWVDRRSAIFDASRQLYHAQWIELARRQMDRAGEPLLMLEPLPYSEIWGTRFFEVFLDNSRWPEHVLTAYYHTKQKLAAFTGERRQRLDAAQ